MKIIASNHFLKFKKKSSGKLQLEIDDHVKKIIENPEMGELKKGDLKGIRIHKFTYGSQLLLMSYEHKPVPGPDRGMESRQRYLTP